MIRYGSTTKERGPDPSSPAFVLDVGGTHVTGALVSGRTISLRETQPIDAHGTADEILGGWAAVGSTLARGNGSADLPWVVAIPDPFDFEAGRGSFENVHKFGSLAHLDLRREIGIRLSVAGDRIHFVHDAAAYSVGEWAFGAGERVRRFVCITLGTGVGSAFLHEGSAITHGEEVPPNGTVHLLEIDGRPLEDRFSTRALTRSYHARTGRDSSVKAIAENARGGDAVARELFSDAASSLGAALRPWTRSFDADIVAFGGSIARAWDLIEVPLQAAFAVPRGRRPEVRQAVLLDDAPLVGANVLRIGAGLVSIGAAR